MVELTTEDMLADYIRRVRFDMLDEEPGTGIQEASLHPQQFDDLPIACPH
jgi:hypothetical protein